MSYNVDQPPAEVVSNDESLSGHNFTSDPYKISSDGDFLNMCQAADPYLIHPNELCSF